MKNVKKRSRLKVKKKKRKSSLSITAMASIIIAVAAVLALTKPVYTFIVQGRAANEIELCKDSIALAASTKKYAAGETITPLKCSRREIVLRKKDIVKGNRINQIKASRIIADAMKECWYMTGEGKIDPFSSWDTEDLSYCLICGTVKFDKALEKFIARNVDKIKAKCPENIESGGVISDDCKEEIARYMIVGPGEYLRTRPISKKTKKTYWQYLYNQKPTSITAKEKDMLDRSLVNPDSIVFLRMYKTEDKSSFWNKAAWVGIGALVVIGTIAVIVLTGGAAIPALIGVGVKIGAVTAAIAVGALVASGTALYFSVMPAYESTFSECAECNGVGGVGFIPSNQDLGLEQQIEIDGDTETAPVCSIIVN